MKFIDQSSSKETILWCQQNTKHWAKYCIFEWAKYKDYKKQFLDKCISIFTARPYCTNWCGISVPLSSNEFQWSRWYISSNSKHLKWLWTVSFHQHAFLVKNKFSPENTKRNISLSYSNSWRQQLSCSIKV